MALVPAGYIEGVRLAGGLPLVLPPTPEGAREPGEVLDAIDGLCLIGGPDLGVDLYGSPPAHPETGPKQERRDAFELALLRRGASAATPGARHLPRDAAARRRRRRRSRPAPRRHDRSHAAPARTRACSDGMRSRRVRHAGGVLLGATVDGALGPSPGRRTRGGRARRLGAAPDGQIEAVEDPGTSRSAWACSGIRRRIPRAPGRRSSVRSCRQPPLRASSGLTSEERHATGRTARGREAARPGREECS